MSSLTWLIILVAGCILIMFVYYTCGFFKLEAEGERYEKGDAQRRKNEAQVELNARHLLSRVSASSCPSTGCSWDVTLPERVTPKKFQSTLNRIAEELKYDVRATGIRRGRNPGEHTIVFKAYCQPTTQIGE